MTMRNKYKYLFVMCSLFLFPQLNGTVYAQTDSSTIINSIDKVEHQLKVLEQNILTYNLKYESTPTKDQDNFRYGLYFSPALLMHAAEFSQLDPILCPSCLNQNYGNQVNYGLEGGITVDYSINNLFGFTIKTGFVTTQINLIQNENFVYNINGVVKNGNIEHSITSNINSIIFDPLVHYWITKNIFLNCGGRFSFSLGKSFEQKETLTSVEQGYTFNNGTLTRNVIDGDIPSINSLQYGIKLGGGYELPLNKSGTVMLVPEFSFGLGLSNFTKQVNWKTNYAAFILALKFSSSPTVDSLSVEKKQEMRVSDSIRLIADRTNLINKRKELENDLREYRLKQAQKELLSGKIIKITQKMEVTNEAELDKIQVDQIKALRVTPILNMVFFDSKSSNIPLRYQLIQSSDRINFDIERIASSIDPMEIYYNILNIIGKRLIDFPNSSIILVGCNDGSETSKEDTTLSYNRAIAISNYFQSVWKIPRKRIKVQARGLPENYTQSQDEFGYSENRRVDIISDNPAILDPIITRGVITSTIKPEKIYTYLDVISGKGIKQWDISLQNAYGYEVAYNPKEFSKVPQLVAWELQNKQELITEVSDKLTFQLMVMDSAGQQIYDTKQLLVQYYESENKAKISNSDYNLMDFRILLPFDNPGLTEDNQRLINLIKDTLNNVNQGNTLITVNGFTDSTGTSERNTNLSLQRAIKVYEYLKLRSSQYSGKGVTFQFNNSLPEGRFYNRSVQVVVKPK